jgi:hypothetical protein
MAKPPVDEQWQVLSVRSIYESKWIKLSLAEVKLVSAALRASQRDDAGGDGCGYQRRRRERLAQLAPPLRA